MGKIVGLTFAEEYKSAEALADHIKKKHPAPEAGVPAQAPGEGGPKD